MAKETVKKDVDEEEEYSLVYNINVYVQTGAAVNITFETGSQMIVQTGHPVPFPKT